MMKNTQQDRFEKKLIRFINDVDKGWRRDRASNANFTDYLNYRDEKNEGIWIHTGRMGKGL